MTLIVSKLTVHHGAIRAVNEVSLTVKKGELAAVIGANGAGKTTLLRTLSGLNKARHGSATWNQHDLLHSKPEFLVRNGVSHVSEGKAVIPELGQRRHIWVTRQALAGRYCEQIYSARADMRLGSSERRNRNGYVTAKDCEDRLAAALIRDVD